jgi:hypothetical protein
VYNKLIQIINRNKKQKEARLTIDGHFTLQWCRFGIQPRSEALARISRAIVTKMLQLFGFGDGY